MAKRFQARVADGEYRSGDFPLLQTGSQLAVRTICTLRSGVVNGEMVGSGLPLEVGMASGAMSEAVAPESP